MYFLHGKVKFLEESFSELFLGEILFVQKYDNPRVWVGLHSCQEMDMFSFV